MKIYFWFLFNQNLEVEQDLWSQADQISWKMIIVGDKSFQSEQETKLVRFHQHLMSSFYTIADDNFMADSYWFILYAHLVRLVFLISNRRIVK